MSPTAPRLPITRPLASRTWASALPPGRHCGVSSLLNPCRAAGSRRWCSCPQAPLGETPPLRHLGGERETLTTRDWSDDNPAREGGSSSTCICRPARSSPQSPMSAALSTGVWLTRASTLRLRASNLPRPLPLTSPQPGRLGPPIVVVLSTGARASSALPPAAPRLTSVIGKSAPPPPLGWPSAPASSSLRPLIAADAWYSAALVGGTSCVRLPP